MEATRSSSPLMVFQRRMSVYGLGVTTPAKESANVTPGKDWEMVKCASKKAYGCGTQGQQLVEGLTLNVQRVGGFPADLTSFLSVSLSDEAAGILEAKLGCCRKNLHGDGEVKIAHRQAVVVFLIFRVRRRVVCGYYLIYDATDASLSLIPYIPDSLEATYTLTPVPERSAGGLIKLALMARLPFPREHERAYRNRLCVWTPAAQIDSTPCVWTPAAQSSPKIDGTPAAQSSPKIDGTPAAQSNPKIDGTPAAQSNPNKGSKKVPYNPKKDITPWQTMVHLFAPPRQPFTLDVSFTFGGKAFWADLSYGVAVSDLMDSGSSVVDTAFIVLPDEYHIDCWADWMEKIESYNPLVNNNAELLDPAKVSRTMGCFEDSIKFVCIDCGRPAGDTVVKVLTLDLDQQLWVEDEGLSFPWDDLWKQVRLMDAELRDLEEPLVPKYPSLMPDGSLVVLLPITPQQGKVEEDYYVCSFDMRSKSPQCFGQVRQCDTPIPGILPFDFFAKAYAHSSRKKLPRNLLQKFEALHVS